MSLLDIFGTAILPIVALAGVGFLLGRVKDLDPEPLNTATVYVLAPALVFHSLVTATLTGATLVRIAVAVVAFHLAMVALVAVLGRVVGLPAPMLSAAVLVAAFPNSGNYGIPLSEFAFGAAGRSTAVLFLTVQAVILYTLGAYIAARGGGTDVRGSLGRVLRLPLVYAVVAAVAMRWFGPALPPDLLSMVGLVGNASIPVLLLVLGAQLASTAYGAAFVRALPAAGLKLVVAPAVGVGVALAVGFDNSTVARTFVLETATPTAITTLLLTVEFGGDATVGDLSVAEYVSTVILVTTLLSVVTLAALVAVLRTGVF